MKSYLLGSLCRVSFFRPCPSQTCGTVAVVSNDPYLHRYASAHLCVNKFLLRNILPSGLFKNFCLSHEASLTFHVVLRDCADPPTKLLFLAFLSAQRTPSLTHEHTFLSRPQTLHRVWQRAQCSLLF